MLVEGVAAHGWSVAIPGYSLAPEASLTEIVAEISRSLDWLAKNGGSYGISGPVVLAGWSAGAQLVAMALGHLSVTAGLAISGVYDLGPIRDTALNNALKLTDQEVARLSPLRLPAVHKRLDIAYGTAELPALVFNLIQLHNRASPRTRQAGSSRSKAQTISAFSASCGVPTARLSISPESSSARSPAA